MASNVGGLSNHGSEQYAEEGLGREEEATAPEAAATTDTAGTETAGPSHQEETPRSAAQLNQANYQRFAQEMGDYDAPQPHDAPPPGFSELRGVRRLDFSPVPGRDNAQYNARQLQAMQSQPDLRSSGRAQGTRGQQAQPPSYGDHTSTPAENPANSPDLRPRASTSRLRRAVSRQPSQASFGTEHSNASVSSFGTNASRVNLAARQGSADVPPVPPLPSSLRRGTMPSRLNLQQGPREGEITSEPAPLSPPPAYEAADSSTGPGTLAGAQAVTASRSRFRLNPFASRRLVDPQGAANHDLREALAKGDGDAIARGLNATNPAPNPATPSSKHLQNAFHKVGKSKGTLSNQTIDQLFEKTPIGQRAAAAVAQDKPARNTPLHYVQEQLGTLAGTPGRDQNQVSRLQYMETKLKAAVGAAGQDPASLDQIRNRDGVTPAQMYADAKRIAERVSSPLGQAGLI